MRCVAAAAACYPLGYIRTILQRNEFDRRSGNVNLYGPPYNRLQGGTISSFLFVLCARVISDVFVGFTFWSVVLGYGARGTRSIYMILWKPFSSNLTIYGVAPTISNCPTLFGHNFDKRGAWPDWWIPILALAVVYEYHLS